MCIGSNSVNQAQDLISVTKFEDFPNSLLPTTQPSPNIVQYRFTLMSKFANTSKWAGLTPYILYSHILQHLSINRTEKRTKFKRFHVARFPKFFSIKSKAGNLFT